MQLLTRAKRHIETHPSYARYPVYSLIVFATASACGETPAPDWYPIYERHWWDVLFSVTYDSSMWIALLLGTVGLFRRGVRAKLAAFAGAAMAYRVLDGLILMMPHDYVIWWAKDAFYYVWDVPASLLHDWFDGNPAVVVPLWVTYLAAAYVALRLAALWAWQRVPHKRSAFRARWAAVRAGLLSCFAVRTAGAIAPATKETK